MQHARLPRITSWVFAAVLAGGIAIMLVAGCVQVGDNLTGVDLSKGRPTTCLKQCNDQYKMLYDDEQKAHAEAKALCDAVNCSALPKSQQRACIAARQACQAAEATRHQAAQDALNQGKIDCQSNCHHQGSGTAG
jgi:hypothetical protein